MDNLGDILRHLHKSFMTCDVNSVGYNRTWKSVVFPHIE